MFLSYENDKDIKVALKFSKFLFGYIAKICILQAMVSILAIGLGKKLKKMQFLVISDLHCKDVICIILTCFLFFLASLKSGNDFLYPHHGRSTYL